MDHSPPHSLVGAGVIVNSNADCSTLVFVFFETLYAAVFGLEMTRRAAEEVTERSAKDHGRD